MDRDLERRKVRAARNERADEPGRRRHPDRRHQWLKGFPDAITAVSLQNIVRICIVHLIRISMHFAPCKARKAIAPELKWIYRATDADVGTTRFRILTLGYGEKLSGNRAGLAAKLGERQSVFRRSRRRPADHLHDARRWRRSETPPGCLLRCSYQLWFSHYATFTVGSISSS
jgi:hypothetical protein